MATKPAPGGLLGAGPPVSSSPGSHRGPPAVPPARRCSSEAPRRIASSRSGSPRPEVAGLDMETLRHPHLELDRLHGAGPGDHRPVLHADVKEVRVLEGDLRVCPDPSQEQRISFAEVPKRHSAVGIYMRRAIQDLGLGCPMDIERDEVAGDSSGPQLLTVRGPSPEAICTAACCSPRGNRRHPDGRRAPNRQSSGCQQRTGGEPQCARPMTRSRFRCDPDVTCKTGVARTAQCSDSWKVV